ncbi:single-stranded DNA-binding protein [Streptomyces endophytica]|uniref:single-stranded DNA-binding protein n=1 Tax=Streptomyces endophytica TaxID=2991496 RepID=UPI003C6FC0A1
MNETMVTLVGNAATAVEHRQTTAGVTVARFRLAATSRRWDKAQERWTDGDTSFYTVRSWRGLADNVAASVAVGEPLVVQGRLRLREGEQPPEKGGQRWFSAEVDAVAIGHDLSRGTAAFRRVTRVSRMSTTDQEASPTPRVDREQVPSGRPGLAPQPPESARRLGSRPDGRSEAEAGAEKEAVEPVAEAAAEAATGPITRGIRPRRPQCPETFRGFVDNARSGCLCSVTIAIRIAYGMPLVGTLMRLLHKIRRVLTGAHGADVRLLSSLDLSGEATSPPDRLAQRGNSCFR